MARPQIEISAEQVEKLATLGARTEEIADFFNCSRDTIERRFRAELERGRAGLKIRIRRLQIQAAEKGNGTMLVWLGKQILGQTDQIIVDQKQSFKFAYERPNKKDD